MRHRFDRFGVDVILGFSEKVDGDSEMMSPLIN